MDVELERGGIDQFHQHKLLLDVDAELDSGDLENMKFLCQDVIPFSKLQKIDRGIDLFGQLENGNKISPKVGDFEMLIEILYRVRRLDLVKKLGKNSKDVKKKYGGPDRAVETNLTPFRNLLYEIIEDLTQEEFQTAMFVLKAEFGRGTMSKIHSMMDLFTFLQKEQALEEADVGVLYKIMEYVNRPDLKEKIQEYQNYPYRGGQHTAPVAGYVLPRDETRDGVQMMHGGQTTRMDVEMPDASGEIPQNQFAQRNPALIPRGKNGESISNKQIVYISMMLGREKMWRMIIPELGLDLDQMSKLTDNLDTNESKVKAMLTHWRDNVIKNDLMAGNILFVTLCKDFLPLATELVKKKMFPGMEYIPREPAPADVLMPATPQDPKAFSSPQPQGSGPTHGNQTDGRDFAPGNQPPLAVVSPQGPPVILPTAGNQTGSHHEENITIHEGSAQLSIVPGPQEHGQTGYGQMAGASELPRPAVILTEEERRENELVRDVQRFAIDNEMDLPKYKMDAKPRGIAIIINNETFVKDPRDAHSREMPNRTGTGKDAERLTYIFQKLDFRVEVHNNQTDVEMAQLMSRMGFQDHSNYDCFVCCILTHGATGHVYGSNGKLVRIDILTSFYRAQVCPTLAGKPKLFFIQACQGRDKQGGYDLEADAASAPLHTPERTDLAADPTGRLMIPDEADYILGYATVPGYVSYRSRSQGSWFINKLVDMLDKYAYRYDLMSILVKVNEEVGNAIANMEGGRFKQIPAPLVTLRKKIYFN